MLIDSEKVKEEIEYRLGFLANADNSYFADGYEIGLRQLLSWINLYEDTIKEIKDKL